MQKTTKKKIAPVVITAAVVLLVAPPVVLTLSALGVVVHVSLGAALVLLAFSAFGGAVVGGILKSLLQRLDEIDGGEEEEASQY